VSVNPIYNDCPRCFAAPGFQCVGKRGPRKSCHQARWEKAHTIARDGIGFRREPIGRALAKAVFERDAYRCVDCGDHMDLTCDHIVPVSKGGETSLRNLQTMCRRCNSRKGAR